MSLSSHAISVYEDDDSDCSESWLPSSLRVCTEDNRRSSAQQEELEPLARYTAAMIVSTHPDILPCVLRYISGDKLLWRLRRVSRHWSRTVLRVFGETNGFTGRPRCVSLTLSTVHSRATASANNIRWIERYAPFVASNSVRALELSCSFTLVFLSPASSFMHNLRHLSLTECSMHIGAFLNLPALESLVLIESDTFRRGLLWEDKLACNALALSLRRLQTDSNMPMRTLKRFKHLQTLELRNSNFGDEFVDYPLSRLTDLRVLDIRDSDVKWSGEALQCMANLHTFCCNLTSDWDLSCINACTALSKLHVNMHDSKPSKCEAFILHVATLTTLTDLTLHTLYNTVDTTPLTALTSLTRLTLDTIRLCSYRFVHALTRLTFFSIAGDNVESAFVRPPLSLPLLQELRVEGSVYDELSVLRSLRAFQSLRHVFTHSTTVPVEISSDFHWISFATTPKRYKPAAYRAAGV